MVGVFCTYCGKSFTRKEHLERHIPSHTNVKPHRCTSCQLSFARRFAFHVKGYVEDGPQLTSPRDLLQRHQSSYHEIHDTMQPAPGRTPQLTRRTPIACLNCANAKAGCDKTVPCTRCYEKNLPCEARFARRISKIAVRTAGTAITKRISAQSNSTGNMDVDRDAVETLYGENKFVRSGSVAHPHVHIAGDNDGSSFPDGGYLGGEGFESLPIPVMDSNGFMDFTDNFNNPAIDFQEFLSWGEYPMGLENYSGGDVPSQSCLDGFDLPTCDLSEATSSSSYARTSRSSRASVSTSHTRNTSHASPTPMMSPTKRHACIDTRMKTPFISEFEAVIAAEDAWPLARCNPPIFSDTCPRTGIVHLETLEQNSQNPTVWDSLMDNQDFAMDHPTSIAIVPLNSSTRDKILAITQSFLHKALKTHRGGLNSWPKSAAPQNSGGGFSFLVLPPAGTLEYFLQNYVRTLTSYYSLIHGGTVDPNELMLNNQASTLLVLLMIAQGATAIPSPQARQLTAGLTETCRISLFDLIEKDVELSADPVVLRCALLFTMLAAWGGDKWHMDMAMGQRGMYLAMLKHAGMMEPQPPFTPVFDNCSSKDLQWRTWVRRETRNRLVYNWVMADQELSLFHDTPCVLSTTELQTPIPSDEALWLAKDADEWLAALCASHDRPDRRTTVPGLTPHFSPSIGDLFQDLLHDNIQSHRQLTPLQLKLLLHPLHSLVSHLGHIITCFSDGPGSLRGNRTVTKASTLSRLEEVQSLLQRWYGLCIFHTGDDPVAPIVQENLVLYHLISLNAVTSFPDIERVARKEHLGESLTHSSTLYKRCIYRGEEALFHCGQVLRLINSIPKHRRPHWWSAAVYRATLIVWLYSLSQAATVPHRVGNENFFAIDAVTPEHPSVTSYLWNGEGIPVLSRSDGGFTELNQPGQVLKHCSQLLTEGISGRMPDGIGRKLQTLYNNWCFDSPDAFT
ncbi:Zn2 DNA-binding protein [Venustampulla echinocandica]|uniref:Zn2 DNA-binding protein n=1 Tax=Venustampulla echinocandica TaxID=2656787 RepID=A0A370TA31_9HELO|nr:Zn2 DNA-binding protein [Venustampulla echinocandica]RDL30668.1 Zn2 DNA-binding protein [Venustampulla echinocandica]